MRSNELATLAGVTVRTLRHYHQVGVLPEPPRSSNGYREYDVHDLVRVLRVKRLTALGIALQDLPEVLDRPDEADALLERLDDELAAEIDRLSARRALIARLRLDRSAPDLPPEIGRYAALFAAATGPSVLARVDREQAILLAHLAGDEGTAELAGFYERLADPALLAAAADLYARFDALDQQTPYAEADRLAADIVAAAAPAVREHLAAGSTLDLGEDVAIILEHTSDVLNDTQRQALTLIEERLTAATSG
ncbi:MerR family transcriptional regulator [Mumia sp. DW29H23]|uniref:helix-turn-helix domain-containing protein n=1 Tax=Mumia sp. DW29H23 TaxID=3421241 RepID=UPI003D6962E9